MNPQMNWQKIRDEFQRIGVEIRNFDYHAMLSPAAQEKVKVFEQRYSELIRRLHQAQRQMDREFNRVLRQIRDQKTRLEKRFSQASSKTVKKTASKKTAGTRKKATTSTKRKKA